MSGGFLALQAKKSKEKKKTGDLEDAFRAADTDKDGKLNLDEWVDVLMKTGHSVNRYFNFFFSTILQLVNLGHFRSEVIDAFREKDKNLDGLMSYEEFVGHESRIELAFKALDTNGDGFVSRSEFKKICPNMTREQVEAAFNKFDKDQTGRINYAEFCSMLNKNK